MDHEPAQCTECDEQSRLTRRQLGLATSALLVGAPGCAGTPKATEVANHASNIWPVRVKGATIYNQSVEFGPFWTGDVTAFSGMKENSESAPVNEQVQFSRLLMVFEITRSGSGTARVRVGTDAIAGKSRTFAEKFYGASYWAGSIAMDGRVVGEFQQKYGSTPTLKASPPTSEPGLGTARGEIRTSVGTIRITQRGIPPASGKSALASAFAASRIRDEYVLGDHIIAAREIRNTLSNVEISPELAVDAQLCIAASMAAAIVQEHREASVNRNIATMNAIQVLPR